MGILRTLLALGVVVGHMGTSAPLQLVGGFAAVRVFYMISGYLMSLILVESGAYAQVRRFYLSRLLRIFPVYAVVAVVSLIVFLAIGYQDFLTIYAESGSLPRTALTLSNILILGQAQIMFLGEVGSRLVYPMSFAFSDVPFWHGLLIPQAWTLEIEILFYLLAPLLLPRRRWLLAVLALSVLARVGLVLAGVGFTDPWSYRFFPAELMFFLAGALVHQVLAPLYDARLAAVTKDRLSILAVVAVALYLFLMPHLAGPSLVVQLALEAVLFCGALAVLPLLLHFQNKNRFDSRIGELSYPIYICHWLPIMVLQPLWLPADFFSSWGGQLSGIAVVMLLAWLLNKIIAQPIERARRRLRTEPAPR